MMDPGEILNATKRNISVVEDQITLLLASLVNDKLLDRNDLNKIVGKPNGESSITSTLRSISQGSGAKRSRITASQKSLGEIPQSVDKALVVPTTLREDHFLLVPCLNKCVLGVTFTNIADSSLSLPSLLMTTISEDRETESNGLSNVEYAYKIILVNSNSSNMESRYDILPIQEGWHGSVDCIRPGCSFKVLVHFAYSGSLVNRSMATRMHLALIVDEKNIWSKIVDLHEYWLHELMEDKMQKSRVDVYLAMAKKSVTFVLESKSSSSISQRLMRFVDNQLHLKRAKSVSTRFDTHVETFLTERLNMLWGLVLEIIICQSNLNRVICVTNAREADQFHCFMGALSHWVQTEIAKDPTLSCALDIDENPEKVIGFLQSELKAMMQLIYLHEIKVFGSTACSGVTGGSRAVNSLNADDQKTSATTKWMRSYIQSMQDSDNYFMKKQ